MNERVVCPACGAPNSGADAYCGACGASLRPAPVPPTPCWNCRAPNPPGRVYCGQCGQPLAGPTTAAAPATPSSSNSGRNAVLLALAIVLMIFLGVATAFLILRLADDGDGGTPGGGATAAPSGEPGETLLPEATETPYATITPEPRRTPKPTPTLGPPGTFVCNAPRSVDGPPGTKWNLVRVDFRSTRGYDRVIYQLKYAGDEDDGIELAARVTPMLAGEGSFVGEPPFLSGDQRLSVTLVNGVHDRAGIDAYEPRGMKIVERLSTQPYRSHVNYSPPEDDPAMAGSGVLSTVDVLGDGCYALRVVGWDGEGDDTASVYVDIQH